ncbi:tRNA lysidine(34) synthetase TilS [Bremerella alba]|uniref:tRNA(Ile)-lysidine synthase n=1 Tax=Bremerella alba TaxID=980252 RepID=A0A7V8V6Y8_9BACT|nr:tRNA lysidine(34) synthetase TilS [Bremerella alba]MBA2116025.1 tRNA(Ile)-lysidine synthase [Bremerella alba]
MSSFPPRFLENWPLASWHGRVTLIAVSGGADSMALLRLMVEASDQQNREKLWVVHVNHGLRGQASGDDLQFVVESAERLGLKYRTRSLSAGVLAPGQTDDGLEAAARAARYGFFEEVALEVGARYLVTAHHQDDQVETVLHRILRGTSVSGLQGIAKARQWLPGVGLVRPLLPFMRHEIVNYLHEIDQPWREDATNAGHEFTRNKIRNDLLPKLREAFGDQVDQSLSRLSSQATECQAVIDDLVDDLLDSSVAIADSKTVQIDLGKLNKIRPYLVRELLVRIWQIQKWPRQDMTQLHWQKLSDLALGHTDAVADVLPGTIRAARQAGILTLKR